MSATKNPNPQFDATAKQKRPIFYLIALALPFILLLIVEGLLRLVGFGHQYPLFIPSSYHAEYLQPNPEVVKRFFHKAELAPPVGPDTFLFKRKKDPDSLRLVFMGGSTAAGFPYGRFGSPAGMLNQRLKAQFPHKNIEIISVAMASINTYSLLDFVDEVIAIQPDAVLMYAGHNEYLGVMGVGSVYASNGSHAANLLFLKLKELRLFQLVQSLYHGIFQSSVNGDHAAVNGAIANGVIANGAVASGAGANGAVANGAVANDAGVEHLDGARTVMASVAKEKNIPYNSDLFKQGLAQFEQNLSAIQSAFSNANIPLYLSTIASNEKDLTPFSSSNSPEIEQLLDKNKARSNRRIIQQGLSLLETASQNSAQYGSQDNVHSGYPDNVHSGSQDNTLSSSQTSTPSAAMSSTMAAAVSAPMSADLAFAVATALLAEDDPRALEYFSMARNYDLLRFRAPSAFNTVIAQTAALTSSHVLVDSEAAIRADTLDGIIGAKHMLEHLHPTPRGYFLIAEAFFQSLLEHDVLSEEIGLIKRSTSHKNSRAIANRQNVIANTKNVITTEQAWANMPLSPVDELVGQHKIAVLTSDYPFTSSKRELAPAKNNTAIEKLANKRISGEPWLTSQQTLLVLLQQQNNIAEAAKAAGLLFDALPHEIEAARVASLLYLQTNQLGFAEHYARRALQVWKSKNEPANSTIANYYLTLAEIIFKSGNVPEAIAVLDDLLSVDKNNQRALTIKQQIQQN